MEKGIRLLFLMWMISCFAAPSSLDAEDGYKLWLRYSRIEESEIRKSYLEQIHNLVISENSDPDGILQKEILMALKSMLGSEIETNTVFKGKNPVYISLLSEFPYRDLFPQLANLPPLGPDAYCIFNGKIKGKKCLFIIANHRNGALYGSFHLLRLMQLRENLSGLDIMEYPKIKIRLLNHWDNLDRTVERGYAGFSIWDWHRLPGYISDRYTDYARANASIGINGTVLTNVNANSWVLKREYLLKVAALADVFRPYGIKVYLTARFNAPSELGGLKTSDPLDPEVRQWWKDKVEEIYSLVPDFGGFLVKANSEGQPGPQDYGRTHADGANMLAEALADHNGIVIWRAFVYSHEVPDDRAKQAYDEFKPLDGRFLPNVIIQVKNGAIDFQPREPFHPLFGATPNTSLGMEFQITQEYLGQATHLVFLPVLYRECLQSDTRAKGKGSEVARVIDGTLFGNELSCISGVSNVGNDRNWTGHPFGQANWYGFGRLAWNHGLSSSQIAGEWIKQNFGLFGKEKDLLEGMMLRSREICVSYMTPLGLHHIMGANHHYGPAPWIDQGRPDWTSVYYHQAGKDGIGFDRTINGSGAVDQYMSGVADSFGNIHTCPEKYLLWFHHPGWDFKLQSGKSLWEELCFSYVSGVEQLKEMMREWETLKINIDEQRFGEVKSLLEIQFEEAKWWRDACLLYFREQSGLDLPEFVPPAQYTLDYYKSLTFPYAPGIKPRW